MLAVTLSAAIYDRAVNKKTDNLSEKILLWFSPVRNVQKLICTKSYDDLTCIHGIRFVTIIWIIIGHTLEWNNLNIFRDTFSIPERLSGLEKQPLLKAHYSVDSFFYMSGLLTSYVTIKYTFGDYKNFKYISFFVLRYLRLTPQLGAFLLLFSLLPPMFDGPLWMTYMNKVTDKCYKTWWHNLLYLQNVIDIQNICAIHTWYLAADMQLHWMSLIPVVLLLKNRRNGIMFTKILILVCICFSAITIFIRKFPPGSVITSKNDYLDEDGVPSDFIKFFYKPWNHANVFFIGFIFGSYIQSNNNLGQYSLKKSTKYLYWLLAFAGYLFCMYSTAPWLHGRPYDPFWSAVLFPLNRTIWALVLTLVIWLCLTKNGSLVGRLLSWSGFRPLSRMTYSVYLTHSWVLWVVLGARRDLIDLSATFITLLCAGVIVLSYFIGFIFTILFETPLIHVIEYIKHTWLNDKANDLKVNQLTRQSEEKEDEKGVKLLEVQSSNL